MAHFASTSALQLARHSVQEHLFCETVLQSGHPTRRGPGPEAKGMTAERAEARPHANTTQAQDRKGPEEKGKDRHDTAQAGQERGRTRQTDKPASRATSRQASRAASRVPQKKRSPQDTLRRNTEQKGSASRPSHNLRPTTSPASGPAPPSTPPDTQAAQPSTRKLTKAKPQAHRER